MDTLLYPIRAVAKLTGVSVHTLRAWERRYDVVKPRRDERGRLYTNADVERIRLLNAAVKSGHTIGRLAEMEDEELRELVGSKAPTLAPEWQNENFTKKVVDAPRVVMEAVLRLDHSQAERELGLLAGVLSSRDLVHRVALPLLRETGQAWHDGRMSIAQEHLLSALLRNLLGGMIPHYHRNSTPAKILFATPSGELHEFGVLLSAILAAGGGLSIVYLGSNLPADEIVAAAHKTAPEAVILGFTGASGVSSGINDIEEAAHRLPSHTELWVGGIIEKELVQRIDRTRAILIENFEILERHLMRLGARF